ncbi:dipeptidase [Desertihabitans aurantiacus]|uniref:dipeptidase n=1 Tax=Desertihabitans aurantiacus TaxID=2282477 RepID=UPI0022B7E8B5|nr:dipeptidase [Desertihabitans aurantiacus]
MPTTEALAAALDQVMPRVRQDLAELVAIPSVSADPAHADDVRRSAEKVAELARELGAADVSVVTEDGGQPAVIAHWPAAAGAPTVCLYAHHDVQPTGDATRWSSEPFAATERGERVFGRGAADDKGGLSVHLAALRALGGRPPVGVTLFVEGEEEIGSPTLSQTLTAHAEAIAADVFVIADSANWDVGAPAFTTTLRGLADCVVEVATLDHALHSGQYGGVVPDALTALSRLLATLHDEHGSVAVEGLTGTDGPDLEYPEERLRAETGILDGVRWTGTGSVVSRLWTQPAISVLAIDATPVAQASNTLVPSARAKLSLRVPPHLDAVDALERLVAHLETHAPWGARVEVTRGSTGQPSTVPLTGRHAEAARRAFADAWGVEPVEVGQGGSIPMVAEFAHRFPDATVLVSAVVDPDSRMHGIDESMHLGDFGRACLAELLLLTRLAEGQPA